MAEPTQHGAEPARPQSTLVVHPTIEKRKIRVELRQRMNLACIVVKEEKLAARGLDLFHLVGPLKPFLSYRKLIDILNGSVVCVFQTHA